MNRKERKQVEKHLGLDKFYKTMSREKRFEKMRNNIIAGKQTQEEAKKRVEVMIQQQIDQKESDVIASNAEFIAKQKKIPIIDAMMIAKEEYDKTKR